jgi:ethanolamine ammonia-lyase large subunit
MIVSNLQDHFMGKLIGLPMGMAPCYTLHSEITMEGQQIAAELLSAAGANYFMDVYLGIDRMLAYFDTAGHDDQTMREIYGLKPAPEYLAWAVSRGIFFEDDDGELVRGPNWGNPRIFCKNEAAFQALVTKVPAAYGLENAGPRPADHVSRAVKANLAVAREAIYAEMEPQYLGRMAFRRVATAAETKAAHLNDPEKGARLPESERAKLKAEAADVQIIVSDGLSAEAVHHNIPSLLPVLVESLEARSINVGQPILAPHGRVKLAEEIGDTLKPQLVINLIGERPGGDAIASRSLSAYLAYRVGEAGSDARYEYSVISNIYSGGLPPEGAGRLIAERASEILTYKAAGNRLERLLAARGTKEAEA